LDPALRTGIARHFGAELIMLPALLRLFFGCNHEFGFPVTDTENHRTYQVCVHCGVEYEYDWEHMTRLRRVPPKFVAPSDRATQRRTGTH